MDSKSARPVGLISPTWAEAAAFVKKIRNRTKKFHDNLTFLLGSISNTNVVFVLSGIGKTNAAHAASVLIRDYCPSFVVNFGIGGAYPGRGLLPGDIAVATTEIYADEGVLLRSGFRPIEIIGVPFLKSRRREFFNEFPLDRKLCNTALLSSKLHANSVSGVFATVSTCSGTEDRARYLSRRFNAICENMEGAAVVHICTIYGTPCMEIRGISNMVKDRDKSTWKIKLAAETCQRALVEFLTRD